MTTSLLDDAFAHHVWATARIIDACLPLSPEQLSTGASGTYGSIIDTLRHLVDGDAFYLYGLTGDRAHVINTEDLNLRELQLAMKTNGATWSRLLAQNPDADAVTLERDDDGFERRASMGIRFAQALYHGIDHRSQVCTSLTQLGVEPPDIQVWEYGIQSRRSVESIPDQRP